MDAPPLEHLSNTSPCKLPPLSKPQMKSTTPLKMVSKPKKPFVELDIGQRKGGKGSQWQMRRTNTQ